MAYVLVFSTWVELNYDLSCAFFLAFLFGRSREVLCYKELLDCGVLLHFLTYFLMGKVSQCVELLCLWFSTFLATSDPFITFLNVVVPQLRITELEYVKKRYGGLP